MQLSPKDREHFFRRTAMSVGIFLFFLSVAANVFFLVTHNTSAPPEQGIFFPRYEEEPLLLEPLAFGDVQRGFPPRTQKISAENILQPVDHYIVPDGIVPPLSGAALPLFRDQGVPLDEDAVRRTFDRLGVSIHWQDLQMLPTLERWRTADRTMELALDIAKRALTITRVGAFSPSAEGRANDEEAIAIARDFSVSLGIDPVSFGAPRIIERSTELSGPTKTYVVWPMTFKDVPLLDIDAEPVPAVQVQVGRLSRKALSMTVTLLRPDRMSLSAYPRASKDNVIASLREGGLLPVSKDLKGAKKDVVFTSLEPSYVLLLGDHDYPTYIVPALLAHFTQETVSGRTFVPAISPDRFLWRPVAPSVAVPATGTGAVK